MCSYNKSLFFTHLKFKAGIPGQSPGESEVGKFSAPQSLGKSFHHCFWGHPGGDFQLAKISGG